jgi:hypothetical protein
MPAPSPPRIETRRAQATHRQPHYLVDPSSVGPARPPPAALVPSPAPARPRAAWHRTAASFHGADGRPAVCPQIAPPELEGTAVPPTDRGLLASTPWSRSSPAGTGSPLLPDGRLAAAEARVAARATGLVGSSGGRRRGVVERDAVELRAVAEGVGLRVRGDRLEATWLRHAWSQIDEGLRAGLTFAAWCQQVTFSSLPTRQSIGSSSTSTSTTHNAMPPPAAVGGFGVDLALLSRGRWSHDERRR